MAYIKIPIRKRLRRKKQLLPKAKSNRSPKNLLFFDTETKESINADGDAVQLLHLGVIIHVTLRPDLSIKKRRVIRFTTSHEFIDYLLSMKTKRNPILCFAHNTWFDLAAMDFPNLLLEYGVETEPPIVNGNIFLWTIKTDSGTIRFADTFNYAPISLEQIGDDIGIHKLKVDLDDISDEKLFTYCVRDVEIVEGFILKFIRFLRSNDLGSFKLTMASQAFTTYRYRFMTTQPEIVPNPSLELSERLAYFGGRCEAFFIGNMDNQKFYMLDVNSLYPYAMMNERIPSSVNRLQTNPDNSYIKLMTDNCYCVVEATIDIEQEYVPFKSETHLLFPVGQPRVWLHDPEYRHVLKYGKIIKIHTIITYKTAPLFQDYVNFFYPMKLQAGREGDKTEYALAKLFQNTLYGKFAQRNFSSEITEDKRPSQYWTQTGFNLTKQREERHTHWNTKIYKTVMEGLAYYSIPSIAGAITSYARMILWDYMIICGLENVYYVDTDSIMTNFEGYIRLKDHTDNYRLGALKLENESTRIEIHGAKDYSFGDKVRHKGIPRKSKQLKPTLWEVTQFEKFQSWVNRGAKPGVRISKHTKQRRHKYSKRKILKSGLTIAWHIVENKIVNAD